MFWETKSTKSPKMLLLNELDDLLCLDIVMEWLEPSSYMVLVNSFCCNSEGTEYIHRIMNSSHFSKKKYLLSASKLMRGYIRNEIPAIDKDEAEAVFSSKPFIPRAVTNVSLHISMENITKYHFYHLEQVSSLTLHTVWNGGKNNFEFINFCSNLRALSTDISGYCEEFCREIRSTILSQLEDFYITNNDDDSVNTNKLLFLIGDHCSNLVAFRFLNNKRTKELCGAMKSIMQNNPNLKKLTIHRLEIFDPDDLLSAISQTCHDITNIEIEFEKFPKVEAVTKLLLNCKLLKFVWLRGYTWVELDREHVYRQILFHHDFVKKIHFIFGNYKEFFNIHTKLGEEMGVELNWRNIQLWFV